MTDDHKRMREIVFATAWAQEFSRLRRERGERGDDPGPLDQGEHERLEREDYQAARHHAGYVTSRFDMYQPGGKREE